MYDPSKCEYPFPTACYWEVKLWHTYNDSLSRPSLLQLFDEENPVHKSGNKFMFTTEGHVVSVDERFRTSLWEDILPAQEGSAHRSKPPELKAANFSSNVRNTQAAPAWGGTGAGSTDRAFASAAGECFLQKRQTPEELP